MFTLLDHVGFEIPLTLFLLALLGLRRTVTPRTSLWIKASPEKLWAVLSVYDGKHEDWGRFIIDTTCVDPANQIYRKTYAMIAPNGSRRTSEALFRLSQNDQPLHVELIREGLEGKSLNNELLSISHRLTPEKGGTRLHTVYHWGPRALIGQLMARTDLWGGAFRTKSLAETGKPSDRAYFWITIGVAALTGLASLLAFGLITGMIFAVMLVIALAVHEFGHLLAFRLMGQPWGRMIFLPFLGALAVPRQSFESQGQSVFAALMGPGFSAILAGLCMMPFWWGNAHPLIAVMGAVTAALNIFNMLPAEPLDGGIALRSVLSRLVGSYAHWALMGLGAGITLAGLWLSMPVLILFGVLGIVANIKPRKIDKGLYPLSSLQMAITAFGYVAIVTAHLSLMKYFSHQLMLLQS